MPLDNSSAALDTEVKKKTIVAREFIHSNYVRLRDGGDAVIVKAHVHYDDGTWEPRIEVLRDPKRSWYMSNKATQQSHKYKREWDDLKNLDRFEVRNVDLEMDVAKKVLGYTPRSARLRELCDSPYIYGADIGIEALIKHNWQQKFKASGLKTTPISTGFYDIESSVVKGSYGQIQLISVTHENNIYTAINSNWFYVVDKKTGSRRPGNIEELQNFVQTTFGNFTDDMVRDLRGGKEVADRETEKKVKLMSRIKDFNFFYDVSDSQVKMIKWIFSMIHKNKTDFIGIWNQKFDIPKTLAALKEANVAYEDVFCPPDLPREYRKVQWRPDHKNVPHFTQKWDWLHNSSGTQFLDSMCLYSINRIVKGKETRYSLNHILKVNGIGNGKFYFKDDDDEKISKLRGTAWHHHMQTMEFYKYIVYHQYDVISLQLQEWQNHDIEAMCAHIGPSHLSIFTRQTRRVSDSMYFYCLTKGKVLASAGTTMKIPLDDLIGRMGGAVLPPQNTRDVGLKLFKDAPNLETLLSPFVNDEDFSALYPSISQAANVCKETKLSTAVQIGNLDSRATQRYFSLLASVNDNAVQIGHEYYGLPDYLEAEELFRQRVLGEAA